MTTLAHFNNDVHQRTYVAFGTAVRKNCCEHGCRLGLAGISNYAVLKGEDVVKDGKVCDCIMIHDTDPPRVLLIELKSGNIKIGQVIEKFLGGIDIIPQVERYILGNKRYQISLLVLTKRRMRKSFYKFWRSHRLKINGKRHSVQILKCGVELASVYDDL